MKVSVANIELLFFLIQMSFKKLEGISGQENSPTIYQSFSQIVVWASSFWANHLHVNMYVLV